MQGRAIVERSLLDHHVGSTENDFQISENVEPGCLPGKIRKIAPLHRHRTEDEGWYVLEGILRFQFGTQVFDAPKGSGILLPHGTAHTFWNPGPDPVHYLIIARPKTVALLEELHSGKGHGSRSLGDIFAQFDVDLLE